MLVVLDEDHREIFPVNKHDLETENEQNREVEPCKHLHAGDHIKMHSEYQFGEEASHVKQLMREPTSLWLALPQD